MCLSSYPPFIHSGANVFFSLNGEYLYLRRSLYLKVYLRVSGLHFVPCLIDISLEWFYAWSIFLVYLLIYSINTYWAHGHHGYHDKQNWRSLHEVNNNGNNQMKIITCSERWMQYYIHFSQSTYKKYNSLYIIYNYPGIIFFNHLQQPCNR